MSGTELLTPMGTIHPPTPAQEALVLAWIARNTDDPQERRNVAAALGLGGRR